ncbi:cation diffusion facilitator family transporter [Beijerinckia indica]|uniref:Cation diffusion facilitator family transporter n=1 Tax=Beijerinckia indica subsp. indica (strain ATCC 9039 / DSM 1715 / NCIMB 8712) TaxID=395963 RepID=B2IGX8_BEII9|nr:cation diffusion facilitator family transporter [Beijerinckia indica subsp. indica ATCC 9039]
MSDRQGPPHAHHTISQASSTPLHDHDAHDHGHEHHMHAVTDYGRRFIIGIGLNILIVVLEVLFGFLGNSVALIADAGHNLSDVLSLVMAYAAHRLAKRPPSARYTYGLHGFSILAALFNAVALLLVSGALSWESLRRLFTPEPVTASLMMGMALAGMIINALTAALFISGSKEDLNIRGAFLHMASDALISAGVLIGGLLIALTGLLWLDPAISLLINAVIILGTWSLLRESLAMSLNAVPSGIETETVRAYLLSLPGVQGLHDLHIWPVSTSETALTAHVLMPGGHPGDEFLMRTSAELRDHYRIGHVTLQIESDGATLCALAPDHVV